MRQRGYAIAFVLMLLAAVAGAFLGGRFLLRSLQQEFGSGQTWTPPELTVTPRPGQMLPTPTLTALAARPAATRSPVPPRQGGPATPIATTPAPGATPVLPALTPTPTETPIATVTATIVSTFDYVLARPVRHSTGDCPGSYILGQISDSFGNPLPGLSLWLVDEYGNQVATTTKAGAGDAGRYDFPLFGPPRRFYLGVMDANGRPISPRIEILHGVGPNAGATCHWADWQRR